MVQRTETLPARCPPSLAASGPNLPLNQILQGDCVEEMRKLPDGCADLVFADPP